MKIPLQEDEHEALLELAVVGTVRPGRFDHPSVFDVTEVRLLDAGAIRIDAGSYAVTELGKRLLREDSAYRSHGLRLVEGRD